MTETVSGQGGKGDQPRRIQIPRTEYELKHDLIFGKTQDIKDEARKKLIEMGVIKE